MPCTARTKQREREGGSQRSSPRFGCGCIERRLGKMVLWTLRVFLKPLSSSGHEIIHKTGTYLGKYLELLGPSSIKHSVLTCSFVLHLPAHSTGNQAHSFDKPLIPSGLRSTITMAAPGEKYVFYTYEPSMAAAVLFIVLFGLSTMWHVLQMVQNRTWFFVPFVLGGLCTSPPSKHLESFSPGGQKLGLMGERQSKRSVTSDAPSRPPRRPPTPRTPTSSRARCCCWARPSTPPPCT